MKNFVVPARPLKVFPLLFPILFLASLINPVMVSKAEARIKTNSLPFLQENDAAHKVFLPLVLSSNQNNPPTPLTTNDFLYGIVEPSGMVSGSATFESEIRDWQSRGFSSALIMNDVPDLSVSDRLNFKIIASPLYDLYRQWFYYEKYQTSTQLCNGNITIDCARQVIGPIVDKLKTHPSVKGYYTIDDAPVSLKERIRLATQVFKEHDSKNPASPGLLQVGEGQTVYEHARPNVFITYFYPAWNAYPPCNFYTDQYRDWVDRTRETIQARPMSVPFWAILQAHGAPTGMLRTPTVEEVRLLNWLAVGEDAKGIFWFTWSTVPGEFWTGLKDNPALLAEVTALGKRVKALSPYLYPARKVSDKFQIASSGNGYVSTLKDFSTGKLYVLAVNQSCASQNLRLTSAFYNAKLKDLETGAIIDVGASLSFRGGDGKLFEVVNPIALTPPLPQPNLVQNPSFEADANHDRTPDRWTVAASAVIDSTVHHTGSASLKVTGTSATVTLQDVTLKPNTKYYISWYMKAQNLIESRLGVQYFETSPARIYLDSVLWDQNGSYDWVKRVGFFKTPADYVTGQVIIGWNVKSGSTYWVDDVVLCEADKPCADGYLKERE